MTHYQRPTSPVINQFFAPLEDAYAGSHNRYDCRAIADLDFLEIGVARCLSQVASGRDFLQQHADHGCLDITNDHFFKANKSGRRLANLESVNANLAQPMALHCVDPYAGIKEANGDRAKQAKKLQTGHFFMLNMRNHHMFHYALAELRPGGGNEHDMHVLKRKGVKSLRFGAKVGRKVMIVWDRACIDFGFWDEAKRQGVYFISREKANMKIQVCGIPFDFDRDDPRNAGISADERVGPGGGGSMLRRVTYTDAKGTTYKYLTTEMTLPAWAIVLLFKHRWDIEKVFDEVKNKMHERKSWGSGEIAKTVHANFISLTHNLMILLEEQIEEEENVSNTFERERKAEREAKAKKSGAGFIATAIQRFTVRSVKFMRWLRNFLYQGIGWDDALVRLAKIYSTR